MNAFLFLSMTFQDSTGTTVCRAGASNATLDEVAGMMRRAIIDPPATAVQVTCIVEGLAAVVERTERAAITPGGRLALDAARTVADVVRLDVPAVIVDGGAVVADVAAVVAPPAARRRGQTG